MLKESLYVYDLSERRDNFSGASNNYDLWLIDEFQVYFMSKRVLNKVLDRQKVRLDAKYGHSFFKTKNVPVILVSLLRTRFQSSKTPGIKGHLTLGL